ncbi:GNAT family N-acetyltransferase [Promicromonospora sp. Populi]|uniref:GNAT family N-acetyltransferase n=1 Tax=Promicromonospora sp. Populi TaxID=3239420 RepID=UPI0034E1D825
MPSTDIRDLDPLLANIRAYWLGWGVDVRRDDGVSWYRSGIAHPRLNAVLRVDDPDVVGTLTDVRRNLDGVPWIWDVNLDSAPGTEEALLEAGAEPIGSMPIMALDLAKLPEETAGSSEVRFAQTDVDAVAQQVSTYAASMGVPDDQYERTVAVEQVRSYPGMRFERFHASIDGELVGTAETLVNGEAAGLYLVATPADRRRQGIASALSAYALRRARDLGARIATLQASEPGEPVYRGIGFEEVGRTRSFIVPTPARAEL